MINIHDCEVSLKPSSCPAIDDCLILWQTEQKLICEMGWEMQEGEGWAP